MRFLSLAAIAALSFVFLSPLRVASHAYFAYPVPRVIYSTQASNTINATLSPPGLDQGPVFGLYANTTLPSGDPALTSCTRPSQYIYAPGKLSGADPGFTATSASTLSGQTWTAGSTVTITIFVSQIHSPENQVLYPTDGWVVNYRDGNVTGSTFSPLSMTVQNYNAPSTQLGPVNLQGSSTTGTGPFPTINWFYYQNVTATITVPSTPTNDGVLQFFWRNNDINPTSTTPGVVFMSCADVVIVAAQQQQHGAAFQQYGVPTVLASILAAASAMFALMQ